MPASQDHVSPSTPLGSRLVAGGASFRVWAPTADAVYVVLHDFDQSRPGHWTPSEPDLLVKASDGTWAGFFPGVVEGSPYRFWTVGPGGSGFKRDPRALELEPSGWPNINAVVRSPDGYPWHDAGFRPPAFNDLVVYQFHVGVFYAVDDLGRDLRPGRVAKFLDVLDRLEYLVALGVNAVEPLPVVEWQGEFSRGYNSSDLFSPEMDYTAAPDEVRDKYLPRINALLRKKALPPLQLPDLVTQVNQLKAMIDLFHVYGIAVLLDVVYNHAGPLDDQSLRFFDHPFNREWWDPDTYFIAGDGWAGGRVFDYSHDPVRAFLIDNALFFLDEYHADGLRYDEVTVIARNNGRPFCRDLTDTLHYARPATIHVAEYWDWDRGNVVSPTPPGLGFDAAWDDRLRGALRGALAASSGGASARVDMDAIRDNLACPPGFPAAWRAVVHLENHDLVDGDHPDVLPRVPALASGGSHRDWYGRSRSRAATALLLTAPGIPMLFMGQEFLEDKPWNNNPARSDQALYWDGLKPAPDGDPVMRDFLRFTAELIALRGRHPALRAEGVNPYFSHVDDRLVACQRWVPGLGRDVILVASFAESTHWDYPLPFPVGGFWHEVFNSDAYDSLPPGGGYNPNAAGNPWGVFVDGPPLGGCPTSARLVLPANALLVLARDLGD